MKRIAICVLLAACGTTPAKPTTPPPPTSVIELGEITVFDGAEAMFKIHTNGSTEIGKRKTVGPGEPTNPVRWEPGPTLHADGTIDAKRGPVAKVTLEGTIIALDTNKPLPIKLADNRVTVTDERGRAVTAELKDGTLTFVDDPDRNKDLKIHVEGADSPGKVRTVLAIFGVLVAPGAPHDDADKSGERPTRSTAAGGAKTIDKPPADGVKVDGPTPEGPAPTTP